MELKAVLPLFYADMYVELLIRTLSMILPILAVLLIGRHCKSRQILNDEGMNGIRSVVSNILLPVVLFNAFFTAEYGRTMLIVFIIVYCGFAIALMLGFAAKRASGQYQIYMPFLVTGSEVGMLGYSLYSLLGGSAPYLATVDIGQTVFAYTIWLSCLQISDSGCGSAKDIFNCFLHSRPAIGMLAGIICGICGLGKLLAGSEAYVIYTQFASFLTAPTSVLILIIVGYDMDFSKDLLRPVFRTALLRIAILATVGTVCTFLIFSFVPFNKDLLMALILVYSLPAPFIIPLFATHAKDSSRYISACYSLETVLTLVIYVPLIIFSVM